MVNWGGKEVWGKTLKWTVTGGLMIPQNSLKSDFKVSNVAKLEHGLSKNFKRNHLFVQKLKIFNIR